LSAAADESKVNFLILEFGFNPDFALGLVMRAVIAKKIRLFGDFPSSTYGMVKSKAATQ
jgi:hypothetical protein